MSKTVLIGLCILSLAAAHGRRVAVRHPDRSLPEQELGRTGSILIAGGTVYDGTGSRGRKADLRISGDTIQEIGRLKPQPGERVVSARGLAVAPGFIDVHSHADNGLLREPDAESQIRQGITTAVVGQDGSSNFPLTQFFRDLEAKHVALNIASFCGHGTVRRQILGADYRRPARQEEEQRMAELVDQEIRSGALGLSSGLEYDPGFYATTEEVIVCARAAARNGGLYISHVRNEDNTALEAFAELFRIARDAHLPAQISHIKLGSRRVWGRSGDVLKQIEAAGAKGMEITADVYPYLYWQSTITALIPSRNWEDRSLWEKGLEDVGGPEHVLLAHYAPQPGWAGKTIAELARSTQRDPVQVIQEIVRSTHRDGAYGGESVVVTAMAEADLRRFLKAPSIMFCTDGGLHSAHPRGAGTYPRILGRYVREARVLTLEKALFKMTGMPAARMGLLNRGRLLPGYKADLVLFDPRTVLDTSTTAHPESAPRGIPYVFVNGAIVLDRGRMTAERPGVVLRRSIRRAPECMSLTATPGRSFREFRNECGPFRSRGGGVLHRRPRSGRLSP